LRWLYADSVSTRQSEIRVTRAKESGKWLLDDPEFKKWKEDNPKKHLLMCTGKGMFLYKLTTDQRGFREIVYNVSPSSNV